MGKEAIKKLLVEFQKKASEQAFQKTFDVDISSYDVKDVQSVLAKTFSQAMADSAGDMFDIVDKMIDMKLATATVTPMLVSPPSGGTVTGKIIINGN